MKIEITGTRTRQITLKTGDRAGQSASIRIADGYAHIPGHRYPVAVSLSIGRDQTEPAPGNYILGPRSYVVDRYGALALSRYPELVPAPKQ